MGAERPPEAACPTPLSWCTRNWNTHIRRQNPGDQVNRDRKKAIEVRTPAIGSGVRPEELL